MKRWKVILAAVLIFVSGVVTGALGWRAVISRSPSAHARPMPPSILDAKFDALRHMQDALDLSPTQTERIDAILQSGRKRMRQVWETSCQPQIREEMHRVHEQICAELNSDQRARYEELVKRARERHLQERREMDGHRGGLKSPDGRAEPPPLEAPTASEGPK